MVFLNILILWTQTTINIPVGNSIEYYKYLPQAQLVIDGKNIYDSQVYYEMEVDRTFFSVVNTNLLGVYTVKYRVYFPSYNQESTQTISFNVIDQTPPEVVYIPDYSYPVGSRNIDLTTGIKLSDNYDHENDLSIKIVNEHQINTNIPNTYNIVYEFKDLSNNITTYNHSVNIYDNIPPEIVQKNEVNLLIGDIFDYSKYFTVTDNIDKVLNVIIDDSLVNYYRKGQYEAIITVYDNSGNQNSYSFNIYINDNVAPEIILKQQSIIISLLDYKDTSFYQNLILKINDNYDNLLVEDVIINDYVSYEIIGTYDVIFTIVDSSNNVATKVLKVKIEDLISPHITLIKPLVIEVLSLYIDFEEYFLITDNWSDSRNINTSIKGSYKLDVVGQYVITIEATDENKNKTTKNFILNVIDSSPPIIEVDNQLQLAHINELSKYINVYDNYDYNPIVEIDISKVVPLTIGTYSVMITARDNSNNSTSKIINVEITDLTAPTIKALVSYISISYEEIQLDNFINDLGITITDDYTKSEHIITSYEHNIKFGFVGNYELLITATDQSNNSSYYKIDIIVEDRNPPIIINDDTIILNNPVKIVELENFLTTIDYSNNIKFTWNDQTQVLNKPGLYLIPVLISDEYGNYTYYQISVKITKKPITNNIYFWISSLILAITSITVITLHISKQKQFNHFDN